MMGTRTKLWCPLICFPAFFAGALGSPPTSTVPSSPGFIYDQAPFASAHASNIVELRNGDLLASWFGGSAEGKPDVAIWASRRTGTGWSAPYELVREPDIACYNP